MATKGGFKSRKLLLCILGIVIITGITCLSILYPTLSNVLPTFSGSIIAIISLYLTGNITNKYVINKTQPTLLLKNDKDNDSEKEKDNKEEVGDQPEGSE